MSSAPESSFLNHLFERLNLAGIRYAVMRNHAALPEDAQGSDLDILVAEVDGIRAKAVVLEAVRIANGVQLGAYETVGFAKICALGMAPGSHWWGLCIDLNQGLYFRGQRLLAESVALPLRHHHGIAVLDDGFAGVLGVLKELLNNSVFPPRYAASACKQARTDWTSIAQLLSPMGTFAVSLLHQILVGDYSPFELRKACGSLRKAVFRHAFLHQPLQWATRRWMVEWSKVRRYIAPPGIMLAVLGVDGAGKSTVICSILPVLMRATHNGVLVKHLRPGLLPPLSRLKGNSITPPGPVTEPHSSTPSGMAGSLFRVSYLTLDYVLGYWFLIRPKISKQPAVVLIDRYAYDMYLDPRRFRIGLSGRVTRWFTKLAPKPDLIFCLHGEPEVIAARKNELSLEETRRQTRELIEFLARESCAVSISTDSSIENTHDQVMTALYSFLLTKRQVSAE